MQIKEVATEVIGKSDRLLSSLGLLTITVIKQKYLPQVRRFAETELPDSIAIAGIFELNGFHHILFGYGITTFKPGRIGIHEYATKLVREEKPEIFERPDNRREREANYIKEVQEVEKRCKELKEVLPQIFIS